MSISPKEKVVFGRLIMDPGSQVVLFYPQLCVEKKWPNTDTKSSCQLEQQLAEKPTMISVFLDIAFQIQSISFSQRILLARRNFEENDAPRRTSSHFPDLEGFFTTMKLDTASINPKICDQLRDLERLPDDAQKDLLRYLSDRYTIGTIDEEAVASFVRKLFE